MALRSGALISTGKYQYPMHHVLASIENLQL